MTLTESGRFRFLRCIWPCPACCVFWLRRLRKSFGELRSLDSRGRLSLRGFRRVLLFWFHHLSLLLRPLTSQCRILASALQPLPAIHGHDFSIDVPGAIANQECGQVG